MRRWGSARTPSNRSSHARTPRSPRSRRSRRSRLPDRRTVDTRTDAERALELAYRYIGRRERTVAEVTQRLHCAEFEPSAVEGAVAELREFGYLDDARFARVFAEDKRTLEDWGRDRLERGLLERGIARELIGSVLDATADGGESESERAAALLRRRFPAPPQTPRDRQRALGVLVRKGYDSEVAYAAVRSWSS